MPSSTTLRGLYAAPPAFHTEWFTVPGGHELHLQQFGSPHGLPALVLHGGPGSGCSPLLHRFFDPQRYRVICVDQRGAGLSRPNGAITDNTTFDLLADLRRVREHLRLDRWLVVGGSWGATLALAHALDLPEAVSGLLLRGLFLARARDVATFFDGGAHGRPETWQAFEKLAAEQGCTLTELLCRTLDTIDSAEARATALRWWNWERTLSGSDTTPTAEPAGPALAALCARYRVQSHYLSHNCWLDAPPLLDRCVALTDVPTLLLHGRLDRVCPPEGAVEWRARAPYGRLRWIDGAGHDPTHPGMIDAMVTSLDHYASRGAFDDEVRP